MHARAALYQVELRAQNKNEERAANQFLVKIKKEVIHPQVPLRIPCDDLSHLAELRFDAFTNWTSSKHYSGGLTGGVCKEQGHIHRSMMRNDY